MSRDTLKLVGRWLVSIFLKLVLARSILLGALPPVPKVKEAQSNVDMWILGNLGLPRLHPDNYHYLTASLRPQSVWQIIRRAAEQELVLRRGLNRGTKQHETSIMKECVTLIQTSTAVARSSMRADLLWKQAATLWSGQVTLAGCNIASHRKGNVFLVRVVNTVFHAI